MTTSSTWRCQAGWGCSSRWRGAGLWFRPRAVSAQQTSSFKRPCNLRYASALSPLAPFWVWLSRPPSALTLSAT